LPKWQYAVATVEAKETKTNQKTKVTQITHPYVNLKTRPDTSRVGQFLRYCATLVIVVVVAMFTSVFAFSNTTFAATNSTMNFQSRILLANGALVPDGNYNVEFKIYDSVNAGATAQSVCSLNSSTDDCWWVETRTGASVVRVVNGYVSVNLGSVTPFGASIPWDQDLYITMRIGGVGPPVWDTEMVNATTGRMKLNASPYATVAGKLKTTSGANSTTVGFAAPTGTNTITFGDGSGLVCLNNGNCNTAAGGYLLFGSSSVQNGSTATPLLQANQQGAGSIVDLQSAGTSKFSIGNDGLTTIASGVRISNTTSAIAGTIRWTGTDYEGYTGTVWKSLTSGGGGGGAGFHIVKTINETVNNTGVPAAQNTGAVLQDDDQLQFSIGANENWTYRFVIQSNAGTVPDLQFAVNGPVGATCNYGFIDPEGATSAGNFACNTTTGLVPGTGLNEIYEVAGSIRNGATAGIVTLRWAQNTANAANITVFGGSFVDANRSTVGVVGQPFTQGGNGFSTTAVLGTTDAQALSIITNGTEKMRVDASGNIGIGDSTPLALFTVGTADAFQVNASGNILTSGTLNVGGLTTLSGNLAVTGTSTFSGNILANGSATATAGTTTGTGTATTTLNLAADVFSVNDVVLIDNVGQDYYTRVTVDPGTGSYTVSPAVTFEAARPVTKYNVQNVGASSTDYITRANRFFQGYFLGGVTVGAGSTTLSDGLLSRTTGDITLNPGTGGIVSVAGTINATSYTGDGSSITNINSTSITGGTISNLNASNISTGTLNDGRLSANVSLLNGVETYSAAKTFGAGATVATGQTLTVNGDIFSDLTGSGLALSGGALSVVYGSTAGTAVQGNTALTCASGTGNLIGGGNAVTLGAGGTCGGITTNSAVSFGTSVTSPIYTGAAGVTLSSGGAGDLVLDSASNVLVLSDATLRRTAAGSTAFELNDAANTTLSITNTNGTGVANLLVEGSVTATSFVGDGSGLTNIGGASLTNLNASNISSGTLNDARLSSNVALLNLAQSFTALKTFGAGAAITTGQNFTVNGDAFTDLTGTGLQISGGALGVIYGSTAGSSVQGNTTLTIAAGSGLTGGSAITLGAGGSSTLAVAFGSIAGSSVQGNTSLTCPTGTGNLTGGGTAITLGTGGTCASLSTNSAVTFATSVSSPIHTSTGAVSFTSGGATTLTIDAGGAAAIGIGQANASAVNIGKAGITTNIAGNTTLSTLDGAGLADCKSINSKLLYDATIKQFLCGNDRGSNIIRKTAAESVSSANTGITLQPDNHMFFNVGANETWFVVVSGSETGANAGGMRAGMSVPAGSVNCTYNLGDNYNAASNSTTSPTCVNTTSAALAAASWFTSDNFNYTGVFTTGATAGVATFQWAQNIANATSLTLPVDAYMTAYKLTGADLAEVYYTSDPSVTPGDVVSISGNGVSQVKKSSVAYESNTIGIVSTRPGQVIGENDGTGYTTLIGMSGRVPVKVTNEGGDIRPGDYLAASNTPGKAMKATKAGQVVGQALTGFSGSDAGVVVAFIKNTYFDGKKSEAEASLVVVPSAIQSGGAISISVASTQALVISNSGSTVFSVDSVGGIVRVGQKNSTTPVVFVLGASDSTEDPTGQNGASYYSNTRGKMRCFENDAWHDCLSASTGEYSIVASKTLWTAIPVGDAEFGTSTDNRAWVDLSNTHEYRLVQNTSIENSTAACVLEYSLDQGAVWSKATLGADTFTFATKGLAKTSWFKLDKPAQKEVIVRINCHSATDGHILEVNSIKLQLR
jgi:hypothetical protein